MDFTKMLLPRSCTCGRKHTCAIKKVIIADGAIQELPSILSEYRSILLVADENTYLAAGKAAEKLLSEQTEAVLVFHREGLVVPNEEAVAEIQAKLTDKTDYILGVGSGVIQDLCKYVSFQAKLPYGIVATAPSMDGYASVGAAMIFKNMKITYDAHVPELFLGDVSVLKDAPMDLIQSGYGDILGKFSCLNDWKLSKVVNGEYFCEEVYSLTYDMLQKTKDLGPELLQRNPEAVQTLTEALVGVGIAMAYVGNSRPASGSEHHMSHFFEVVGILRDEPYFLHGIDVAYSAVSTCKLREKILQLPSPEQKTKFDQSKWESEIRRVYGAAADGVIDLQNKAGRYLKNDIATYREKWDEIREVLQDCPGAEEMEGYLDSIGLNFSDFIRQYGEEKIQNALWFAKDIKDRYSVLWLYYTLFYA